MVLLNPDIVEISKSRSKLNHDISFKLNPDIVEEVILAEERTTEEERIHILEARRRAAAKKKKLKNLGKKNSSDTEEEVEDTGIKYQRRRWRIQVSNIFSTYIYSNKVKTIENSPKKDYNRNS